MYGNTHKFNLSLLVLVHSDIFSDQINLLTNKLKLRAKNKGDWKRHILYYVSTLCHTFIYIYIKKTLEPEQSSLTHWSARADFLMNRSQLNFTTNFWWSFFYCPDTFYMTVYRVGKAVCTHHIKNSLTHLENKNGVGKRLSSRATLKSATSTHE